MQIVEMAPHELDSADPPAVAFALLSVDGERLGAVGARIEGGVASIPAKWLSGEMDLLARIIEHLIETLRTAYGVPELRAAAPTEALAAFYSERFGLLPWQEVLTYQRPSGLGELPPRRTTTRLRPFRLYDVKAVAELLGEPGSVERLLALRERAPAHFTIAEMAGAPVGYAFSYQQGSVGQFKSMVVAPAHRREGIGWDLTLDALQWFDQRGVASELRTQAENRAAQRLYEAMGYQQTGSVQMLHRRL